MAFLIFVIDQELIHKYLEALFCKREKLSTTSNPKSADIVVTYLPFPAPCNKGLALITCYIMYG